MVMGLKNWNFFGIRIQSHNQNLLFLICHLNIYYEKAEVLPFSHVWLYRLLIGCHGLSVFRDEALQFRFSQWDCQFF
jgi:hypothetical protein